MLQGRIERQGMLGRHFSRDPEGIGLVALPMVRDVVRERVIWHF